MAPPSRPASFGVRIVAALAVPALFAAAACSGSSPASHARKIAQMRFADTVEVVTASKDSPAGDGESHARQIVDLFTRWYDRAFLDPKGWSDEAFPEIVEHFTGEAREKVAKEIDSVTIGKARNEVRSVRPDDATIKVTVYVDTDGRPAYAVAKVSFNATAEVLEKGPPLAIVQSGVYYLKREGTDWKVFSYQARADQAQVPEPGGSP